MRYYSAWTCRFINVDPLAGKYANLTPYQYAGNRPINFVDIDGLESPGNTSTPQSGGTYHGGGENNHGIHTVVEGNTLWNLSQRYDVSVEDIQNANNIDASNTTIKVGQQLTIPGQKPAAPTPKVFSAIKLNINNPSESTNQITNSDYLKNVDITKPSTSNYTPTQSPVITQTKEISQRQANENKKIMYMDALKSNPNSIHNPKYYHTPEMRFARAGGDGLLIGAELVAQELAVSKFVDIYKAYRIARIGRLTSTSLEGAGSTTTLTKYWPENGGALGEWTDVMAYKGQVLDRYGSIYGSYTSPVGTTFKSRALSPTTNPADYLKFEVLKPFPMKTSTIAPAFGKIGLGIQYQTPIQINYLLEFGYLKIIR